MGCDRDRGRFRRRPPIISTRWLAVWIAEAILAVAIAFVAISRKARRAGSR